MYTLYLEACEKVPGNTAFILSSQQALTYWEGLKIVHAWARWLTAQGVVQGDRVAILTKNEDLHPFLHLAFAQDKIYKTDSGAIQKSKNKFNASLN